METQRARVWFAPFLPSCPVTRDVPEDGCATSLETHLDLKGVGYLAFHDWSCILFIDLQVNNKRNSWKSWKWSARRTVGCGQVEQETVPFHFKPCTSIWLKRKIAMVPTEHISQSTRWMCKWKFKEQVIRGEQVFPAPLISIQGKELPLHSRRRRDTSSFFWTQPGERSHLSDWWVWEKQTRLSPIGSIFAYIF